MSPCQEIWENVLNIRPLRWRFLRLLYIDIISWIDITFVSKRRNCRIILLFTMGMHMVYGLSCSLYLVFPGIDQFSEWVFESLAWNLCSHEKKKGWILVHLCLFWKKKKKQLVHLRLFWSLWKKQNHKILKQIRVAEVEAERCTSQIIYIFFFFW